MRIIDYSDKYREQTIALIFNILENEFGRHSKGGRPDLFTITETYQKDNGNFWIAVGKEKVIGTVGLSDCGNGVGYLARMYIDKEFRKNGIGTKLLLALIKFAKNKRYKELYLSTWEGFNGAHIFYEKNGFKKITTLPEDLLPRSASDNVFYKLTL